MFSHKACLLLALLAPHAIGATLDDDLLIDPTRPLDYVESADMDSTGPSLPGVSPRYELSSVLIRAGDRIAVINDVRVREGDTVGAALVASIGADRVTLDIDGETETLELYRNSVKTLVKGDE